MFFFLSLACIVSSQLTTNVPGCPGVLNQVTNLHLQQALSEAQSEENGGLGFNMWGAIVDRFGTVCSVAYTGPKRSSQWPGSRLIAAQKAYAANTFSLDNFALSTSNLYAAVMPGGMFAGYPSSYPVSPFAAYSGSPFAWGESNDPLVGQIMGGVNVFGGGVPLYNVSGFLIGGLGVSGDTSCADHNIAYKTRHILRYDYVPFGPASANDILHPDNIIYDIPYIGAESISGYGHPICSADSVTVSESLPEVSSTPA